MSQEAEMAGGLAQLGRAVPEPERSPASTASRAFEGEPGPLQAQGLTATFSVSIGLQIVHDLTD